MNPYRELGLAPTATAAEIRDAYRRLAKVAHPDAGGSAAEFARITAAYDTLADPGRRFAYDRSVARTDATGGASMDEHRRFEDMWHPPGRRRGRTSSRIGNLAVSLVGGVALAAAAVVLRFGSGSKSGPPTPISCAAVRSVSATYRLVRTGAGDVHPRVTLHNASSDVRGAAVRLLVVVSVTAPPSPAPLREYTFGAHDAPAWAGPGTDRTVDLSGARAVVAPGQAVRAVGSALALTVHAAATTLPSGGCAVPFRLAS